MSDEQPKEYGQLIDGVLTTMKALSIADDVQVRVALCIAGDRYVNAYIKQHPLPPDTSAPQGVILRSAMGASFIAEMLICASKVISGHGRDELPRDGPAEKAPTAEAQAAATEEALRAIHKAALP